MKIILFILSFSFYACGDSPLLNHHRENLNSLTQIDLSSQQGENLFPNSGFFYELKWIAPPSLSRSQFEIKFWDKTSTSEGPYANFQNLTFHAYAFMPSMNHGSVPFEIKELEQGVFFVDNVYFYMKGDWTLHLQILKGNELIDEIILNFKL